MPWPSLRGSGAVPVPGTRLQGGSSDASAAPPGGGGISASSARPPRGGSDASVQPPGVELQCISFSGTGEHQGLGTTSAGEAPKPRPRLQGGSSDAPAWSPSSKGRRGAPRSRPLLKRGSSKASVQFLCAEKRRLSTRPPGEELRYLGRSQGGGGSSNASAPPPGRSYNALVPPPGVGGLQIVSSAHRRNSDA
ncbi:hypothetical protein NN561_006297 [Cricetulus griseus]